MPSALPRATTIVRRAAVRADRVADTVSLDHAARAAAVGHLVAVGGLGFDLALTKAAALEDGDALRLDDGRLVTVRAAEEDLLEVRAGNPARLMRLAWQLGGSHVPAEVGADALHVPATAAVAELVRGQGCTASPVRRPFRPEQAAHDHSTCGHDHGPQDHGHAHHREPDHGHGHHAHHDHGHHHAPRPEAAPVSGGHGGHAHGPGCDHDH